MDKQSITLRDLYFGLAAIAKVHVGWPASSLVERAAEIAEIADGMIEAHAAVLPEPMTFDVD